MRGVPVSVRRGILGTGIQEGLLLKPVTYPWAMELYDQLGGHTVLHFANMKANVALSPGTFSFTPPQGVDVIDEDAPPKR